MAYVRPAIFTTGDWDAVDSMYWGVEYYFAPTYGARIGCAVWDSRGPDKFGSRWWQGFWRRGPGSPDIVGSYNGPGTAPDASQAWMLGMTGTQADWASGVGANAFYDPTLSPGFHTFDSPGQIMLPAGTQELFVFVGWDDSTLPPPTPDPCSPLPIPPYPYSGPTLSLGLGPAADVPYKNLLAN